MTQCVPVVADDGAPHRKCKWRAKTKKLCGLLWLLTACHIGSVSGERRVRYPRIRLPCVVSLSEFKRDLLLLQSPS